MSPSATPFQELFLQAFDEVNSTPFAMPYTFAQVNPSGGAFTAVNLAVELCSSEKPLQLEVLRDGNVTTSVVRHPDMLVASFDVYKDISKKLVLSARMVCPHCGQNHNYTITMDQDLAFDMGVLAPHLTQAIRDCEQKWLVRSIPYGLHPKHYDRVKFTNDLLVKGLGNIRVEHYREFPKYPTIMFQTDTGASSQNSLAYVPEPSLGDKITQLFGTWPSAKPPMVSDLPPNFKSVMAGTPAPAISVMPAAFWKDLSDTVFALTDALYLNGMLSYDPFKHVFLLTMPGDINFSAAIPLEVITGACVAFDSKYTSYLPVTKTEAKDVYYAVCLRLSQLKSTGSQLYLTEVAEMGFWKSLLQKTNHGGCAHLLDSKTSRIQYWQNTYRLRMLDGTSKDAPEYNVLLEADILEGWVHSYFSAVSKPASVQSQVNADLKSLTGATFPVFLWEVTSLGFAEYVIKKHKEFAGTQPEDLELEYSLKTLTFCVQNSQCVMWFSVQGMQGLLTAYYSNAPGDTTQPPAEKVPTELQASMPEVQSSFGPYTQPQDHSIPGDPPAFSIVGSGWTGKWGPGEVHAVPVPDSDPSQVSIYDPALGVSGWGSVKLGHPNPVESSKGAKKNAMSGDPPTQLQVKADMADFLKQHASLWPLKFAAGAMGPTLIENLPKPEDDDEPWKD